MINKKKLYKDIKELAIELRLPAAIKDIFEEEAKMHLLMI